MSENTLPDLDIVVLMKFGSHLYGTATENSDQDFRGIFLPNVDDLLLGECVDSYNTSTKDGQGKNTSQDIDTQFHSLKKFLYGLRDGDTGCYDMLFAPEHCIIKSSPTWDKLLSYRNNLVQKDLYGIVHYIYTQASKYGLKGSNIDALVKIIDVLSTLPENDKCLLHWNTIVSQLKDHDRITWHQLPQNDKMVNTIPAFEAMKRKFLATNSVKINLELATRLKGIYGHRAELARKNLGVDWKGMHHAYRVMTQTEELLTTGHITFPRPDVEKLMLIKTGKLPYEQISEELEVGMERLLEIQKNSALPEKLDNDFIRNLILDFHAGMFLPR